MSEMRTAIIAASGPSLSDEQCTIIERAKAQQPDDLEVVAVNDTYKRFGPDYLFAIYAADAQWWRKYYAHVRRYAPKCAYLTADRSVCDRDNMTHVATRIGKGLTPVDVPYIHRHHSSTHQAVEYMVRRRGFSRIVLVGVDCKASVDGKKHWFGEHPKEFRSPQPFDTWIQDWESIAHGAVERGIQIVNCTADTAVTCFRTSDLRTEL